LNYCGPGGGVVGPAIPNDTPRIKRVRKTSQGKNLITILLLNLIDLRLD
jgi:hypothetical protein